MSQDFVERLGKLDCCAVSDAMDKLGLPPAVSGLEQRSTTRRIAGKVMTFRMVKASATRLRAVRAVRLRQYTGKS